MGCLCSGNARCKTTETRNPALLAPPSRRSSCLGGIMLPELQQVEQSQACQVAICCKPYPFTFSLIQSDESSQPLHCLLVVLYLQAVSCGSRCFMPSFPRCQSTSLSLSSCGTRSCTGGFFRSLMVGRRKE